MEVPALADRAATDDDVAGLLAGLEDATGTDPDEGVGAHVAQLLEGDRNCRSAHAGSDDGHGNTTVAAGEDDVAAILQAPVGSPGSDRRYGGHAPGRRGRRRSGRSRQDRRAGGIRSGSWFLLVEYWGTAATRVPTESGTTAGPLPNCTPIL